VAACNVILQERSDVRHVGVGTQLRIFESNCPRQRTVGVLQAQLSAARVGEQRTGEVNRGHTDRQQGCSHPVLTSSERPVRGHVPVANSVTQTQVTQRAAFTNCEVAEEVAFDLGADLADSGVDLRLDAETRLLSGQADVVVAVSVR
jgi:hypothetical protein